MCLFFALGTGIEALSLPQLFKRTMHHVKEPSVVTLLWGVNQFSTIQDIALN